MNGKKARMIRKSVYGEDGSPRFREYKGKIMKKVYLFIDVLGKLHVRDSPKKTLGRDEYQFEEDRVTIFADEKRRAYKYVKRQMVQLSFA